jgi:major membrane immunogen (membrane-anchored lipoprotein)
MATKTFKIGECARGGVITVIATESKVTVIAKDWDHSKGTRRSSDQSNAKELYRLEVSTTDSYAERKLSDWLCEESTSYYSDVVLDWIKSKTTFKANEFMW